MDADPSAAVDSESTSKETEAPRSVKHFDDEKDELEFMGYTGLHRLCALPRNGPLDPRWDDVRRYLGKFSEDDDALLYRKSFALQSVLTSTQKDGFDYTPLHVACFISPPLDVVKLLLELSPNSAEIASAHGDYPLHLALGGFVPSGNEICREILMAYPDARNKTNTRGQTPLVVHLKIMRDYELDPCPYVTKALATSQAVNIRDTKGHSPLYYLGKASTDAFSLYAMSLRFFSADGGKSYGPDSDFTNSSSGPDFTKYERILRIMLCLNPAQCSKENFLRDLTQFPPILQEKCFEYELTRQIINDIVGKGQFIASVRAKSFCWCISFTPPLSVFQLAIRFNRIHITASIGSVCPISNPHCFYTRLFKWL